VEVLKAQPEETVHTLEVKIKSSRGKGELKGWVHAYRLKDEQAQKARRRCYKQSNKKGKQVKKETLFLCGWVIVFTTESPETLSAESIMKIYRIRWQVELAIKRMKSVLDVDKLRARYGSPLAEVWLTGKMLYVVIVDRQARGKVGREWSNLEGERQGSW
jgi:hypothetical protein